MLKTLAGFSLVLCLVIASPGSRFAAQSAAPFTAEDMQRVATVNVLDLSEDGRLVAAAMRRPIDNPETDHGRFGDPTYLNPARASIAIFDTRTGRSWTPFKDLVEARAAAWSRDGRQLAILVASAAPADGPNEGMLSTTLHVWDADKQALRQVPSRGPAHIAANSGLEWTPDGRRVLVTLRTPEEERAARARFEALTDARVIVQQSKEPFLEWDELRRADRQRSLAELDPSTGETRVLLASRKLTNYQPSRDGSFIVLMEDVTEKTDYDVIGGTTSAIRVLAGGSEPRTVNDGKELAGAQIRWSDDGKMFAYAKKGEVFVQSIEDAKPRSLTPKPKDDETGDAKNEPRNDGTKNGPKPEARGARDEEFSAGPFSRDGKRILLTSKKGWYVASVTDGAKERVIELDPKEDAKNPRLTAIDWAPDGSAVYVAWSAPDEWKRGIMRLDVASKTLAPLVQDARLYGNPRLSRDGNTFVYSMTDGDRPAELYAAPASFASTRKLTDLNPWMAGKALPRSELVAYRDVDGKELYGVLRYPIGYVKGQKYPTIFEIYETFFDNGFNGRAAFLANHGYAVFHPSVNLVVGRPGEAWVKGVTSAANRLIDLGVADPDRLGVHGTSYGGYATCLLITQTDRFKAAINISGKVNMISFYTDSPRLGVRNTHAPEKSQDRIGGTLWEYPERYLDHSAVLHADRIKTPLLNITGDLDPNVPASQSREMYYALRRLGKEVEWVRYTRGGHRPPNNLEESVDFETRILSWYDKYLKKDGKKTTNNNQGS
jgi:dipeptidyl aminopeptidase/acylaminoacyl peptidase